MKTFKNARAYNKAKAMLQANSEATQAYLKANKTNCIPSEVCATFPFAKQVNNDLRSAIEVWEFIHNPPQNYFLYINETERTATTWTGEKLGSVSFGHVYRSNMNDKRQSVTIQAINGKTYAGTYFKSAGDYARVKACK